MFKKKISAGFNTLSVSIFNNLFRLRNVCWVFTTLHVCFIYLRIRAQLLERVSKIHISDLKTQCLIYFYLYTYT